MTAGLSSPTVPIKTKKWSSLTTSNMTVVGRRPEKTTFRLD